jgi:hypothetical protein
LQAVSFLDASVTLNGGFCQGQKRLSFVPKLQSQ